MVVGYMRCLRRMTVNLWTLSAAAGVDERHLHQDRGSGSKDDRPGLKAGPDSPQPRRRGT